MNEVVGDVTASSRLFERGGVADVALDDLDPIPPGLE
jgi:hypothetical protein